MTVVDENAYRTKITSEQRATPLWGRPSARAGEAGVTQGKMARLLGLSRSTLNRCSAWTETRRPGSVFNDTVVLALILFFLLCWSPIFTLLPQVRRV